MPVRGALRRRIKRSFRKPTLSERKRDLKRLQGAKQEARLRFDIAKTKRDIAKLKGPSRKSRIARGLLKETESILFGKPARKRKRKRSRDYGFDF